jgi:hypothetical protein
VLVSLESVLFLIRKCHVQDNMHVAFKILENLACSYDVQRLLRGGSIQLLQDIASVSPPQSIWFPPHPSPEDQVEMRRIMTQVQLPPLVFFFFECACRGSGEEG